MKKLSVVIPIFAGAFLAISSVFLFKCPKTESGTYMNCHNANVAVAVLACVIVFLGIVLLRSADRVRSILLSAVMALAAAISAIVPGILVGLCMMPEMTCRAVFRPVDVICSAVILVFGVMDLVCACTCKGEREKK